MKLLHLLIVMILFQSCISSSHVGQEATTLPKHGFEAEGEAGILRVGGGIRYGLLKKIDVGTYYLLNIQDDHKAFPEVSTDFKLQIAGTPEKKFVLSTGLGFGTGIERTTLYNEDYYHSTEESWWMYGGTSLDGYLPLYFTLYLPELGDQFFINCNPYLIYRFGFYEWEYTTGYQEGVWNYRRLNQLYGGTAWAIGQHFGSSTIKLGFNLLFLTGEYGNVEIFATYGLRWNTKKNK